MFLARNSLLEDDGRSGERAIAQRRRPWREVRAGARERGAQWGSGKREIGAEDAQRDRDESELRSQG